MATEASETKDAPLTRPRLPAAAADDAYARYERIFGDLEPPFAYCDLDALWWNAGEMLERAGSKPIRVASKAVRCRELLARILRRDPGFRGSSRSRFPRAFGWRRRASAISSAPTRPPTAGRSASWRASPRVSPTALRW